MKKHDREMISEWWHSMSKIKTFKLSQTLHVASTLFQTYKRIRCCPHVVPASVSKKNIITIKKNIPQQSKNILLQSKKIFRPNSLFPLPFSMVFLSFFHGFASIFHGVHQFSHVFSLVVFNPVHRFSTKFRRFLCFYTAEMMICTYLHDKTDNAFHVFVPKTITVGITEHTEPFVDFSPAKFSDFGDESLQRQLQENHYQIILRNSPSLEEFVICQ